MFLPAKISSKVILVLISIMSTSLNIKGIARTSVSFFELSRAKISTVGVFDVSFLIQTCQSLYPTVNEATFPGNEDDS